MKHAVFAAALSLAAPAVASDFSLGLPIDCTPGESCFIQQYVDRDPGAGAQDYRCGPLSYDGHKGTDFRLPTLVEMRKGVSVLAAASGVVAATRDGMADQRFSSENSASIGGRDCGNGVVLRHIGGYETQYCHLQQGSIRVREGQAVAAGSVLGQVGLSGRTQFPHLHLSVRLNGEIVDPFSPGNTQGCAAPASSLWHVDLPYQPGGILSAGFSERLPDYADVRDGTASRMAMSVDANNLVLFAFAYGGQAGDILTLKIAGPGGAVLEHPNRLEKDQAQYFRAAGKRRKGAPWPSGDYSGQITLTRDGKTLDERMVRISLE